MVMVEALWSDVLTEYFLLDNVVISRDGLRSRGILPLRAIALGDFENRESARAIARERRAWNAEAVIAENVRTAVERNIGLLFGLTHAQVERLRRGETFSIDDGLGRMEVAYRGQPDVATDISPEISEEEFEK